MAEAVEVGNALGVPLSKDLPEDASMNNIDRAAEIILRGVARNRAMIVFPLNARIAWWLHRLHPSIMVLIGRYNMKRFRKIKGRVE